MKLTGILLLMATLTVSANGLAQQVTLDLKNAPLKKVFLEINKQTGYNFLFSDAVLKKANPVTIQVKNVSLPEVLERCFAQQSLQYTIGNNTIVVIQKPAAANTGVREWITVTGRITDEMGEPVQASVKVKGTTKGTATSMDGTFKLEEVEPASILEISGVGIEPFEVAVNGRTVLNLSAKTKMKEGEGVVVHTGYQALPRERTTGSFTVLSQEQLSKQVGSTLLERLEGLVPGLYFDRSRLSTPQITLRGINTIRGDQSPLIVLDNFPYEGDLNLLNPADIESITVLRDAAAASIWGSRAANGVIVINTRQGTFNSPVKVQVTANLSLRSAPDLFYQPQMSVKEYAEWERWLFEQGRYASLENSSRRAVLSPVVELLIARRDGVISPDEAEARFEQLSQRKDIRQDYLDHYYRNELVQRTAVNITGGSGILRFGLSGGLDMTQLNVRENFMHRKTLAFTAGVKPSDKFEITAGINLSDALTQVRTVPFMAGHPYETWLNEDGTPAAVGRDFRQPFVEQAASNGLLDWQYRPLEEIGAGDRSRRDRYFIINLVARWEMAKGLSLETRYQSQAQWYSERERLAASGYAVRNLVNSFTQVDPVTGSVIRPVPEGDIVDFSEDQIVTRSGRVQLNYQRSWNGHHTVYLAGGTEIRQLTNTSRRNRIYGFNESGQTLVPVDYLTRFPQYYSTSQTATQTIPYRDQVGSGADHYVSYYANGAYTYKSRYTVSASARQDATNFFGTRANQRWQPLWSAGLKWQLSREKFFQVPWLSKLDLRFTYGFNGSTGGGSSLATATMSTDIRTFLQAARITNPPNPSLKWEKTRIINWGLDFSTTNNRIRGSVEVYAKRGQDLIGPSPLDPTTGFFTSTYSTIRNYASTSSKGVDIELYTQNIRGRFEWSSVWLFSFNRSKVKEYLGTLTTNAYLTQSIIPGYIPGYYFAYRFAGLDPATGNPVGWLDGQKSTNYATIRSSTTPDQLVAVGSPVAPFFGTWSNTFRWKNFSLELMLAYRFGHYYKRETFTFGINSNHADYELRWQKPGDELRTNVPSVSTDFNNLNNRTLFYNNSTVLFDRADNLRLQMVNLSYRFNNVQLALNAANLGILWKATSHPLDPDIAVGGLPQRPGFSINCSLQL